MEEGYVVRMARDALRIEGDEDVDVDAGSGRLGPRATDCWGEGAAEKACDLLGLPCRGHGVGEVLTNKAMIRLGAC